MEGIKNLVIGETTETLIRAIFENRIAQESTSENLGSIGRTLRIRELRSQVMEFIKNNPNSIITLTSREYKSPKVLELRFANFNDDYLDVTDEDNSVVTIEIADNFTEARIIRKAEVGRDFILTLRAKQ